MLIAIVKLGGENFESAVSGKNVTIIDCWAAWCGACATFEPIFQRVAERHPEHIFGKLNTNTERKLVKKQGIKHILSRKNNPQTNGKIERWFQEYKKHRHMFESDQDFAEWYNNRIHGSLMLEWGETPNEAFIRKLRPECLLGMFLQTLCTEE